MCCARVKEEELERGDEARQSFSFCKGCCAFLIDAPSQLRFGVFAFLTTNNLGLTSIASAFTFFHPPYTFPFSRVHVVRFLSLVFSYTIVYLNQAEYSAVLSHHESAYLTTISLHCESRETTSLAQGTTALDKKSPTASNRSTAQTYSINPQIELLHTPTHSSRQTPCAELLSACFCSPVLELPDCSRMKRTYHMQERCLPSEAQVLPQYLHQQPCRTWKSLSKSFGCYIHNTHDHRPNIDSVKHQD